jgi:hypothetical protein
MLAKQVKVPNVQIGEGGRGPRQLGHNFFFLLKARTMLREFHTCTSSSHCLE